MSTSGRGHLPIESLRATDISPHSHVVQFYTLDSALINSLSGFVRTSLKAGDSVVLIATAAHRRDLKSRLQQSGANLKHVIASGRLRLLDAEETLASIVVDGVPDREAFQRVIGPVFAAARSASRSRFRSAAAFGEMVAVLAAAGDFAGALLIERFWNEFARTTRLVLHCAYPVHLFSQPESEGNYLRICREHTNVVPA